MLYSKNPKNGEKISRLGLGCMRFPRKGGQIDIKKTTELVKSAVDAGVNYFDTAYIYPGSEEALGTALRDTGLRDKVNIATKLPPYLCRSNRDFDKIFEKQLTRLKSDRIDYYLIHMLCDSDSWERMKAYGIIEWIAEKKARGSIGSIGFSYHGGRDEFRGLIDAYDWDFCMIQYNYLDENNQAGKSGLRYATEKGMPIFVMEPLRGGMLASGLPAAAREVFKAADEGRSYAEWGLRWLLDQPEVTMLLSGMNEQSQLEENIRIASETAPGSMTEREREVYPRALSAINSVIKVPCTGCGYCMPCPAGVDIPTCFSCYNESFAVDKMTAVMSYFRSTGFTSSKQSYASKCKKCGKCEQHCPQSIEISKRLGEVSRRLEFAWMRGVMSVFRKVLRLKHKA